MGRAFEYRRAAKEKRWDKMSRMFPKLAKAITVAAKDGGPDPDMNPKLRLAIMNAKSENMPKDNIENAIKRALGKDASDIVESVYEGKGPHGVLVVVEAATDNITRTTANVKYYLSKAGGGQVPSGSLEYMFNRRAVYELENTDSINIEDLELELIDYGVEEIEVEGDTVYLYGDYTSFGSIGKGLEEVNLEAKKATLQRFPTTPVTFTEEQMVDIEKMLDKIEEDEDVQKVFTNIE